MKKIRDLEAKDFPDVNIDKFQEWKNAQGERANKSKIDTPVAIVLFLIIVFFRGFLPSLIFGIGLIAILIYSLPTTIKIIKIQKELGITSKDIRKARKNKYRSNLKEDKGVHEDEPDSMEEKKAKYEEKLKKNKIRRDFRALPKKDTEVNDSFFNVIMSILISAFIGFASYAFLSVSRIIDSFQESEIIKNIILVVLFVSSFIFFMLISVTKKDQKK
jgi:hypothetical protein